MPAKQPEVHAPSDAAHEVSVYLIGRDCRATIASALESVYAQTRPATEVIYLDDGSTDGTVEIATTFTSRGLRILRNATSMGIPAARNRAVSACRCPWIGVLDADDLWRPGKLAAQLAYIESHMGVGLIGSFARLIDQSGQALGTLTAPTSDLNIKRNELLRNCFIHSSVLFRRDIFDAVGGYADLPAAQDYDLMLKISERAPVDNLPLTLTDYRMGNASISVRKRKIQRSCTRMARKAAYDRRGIRPGPRGLVTALTHEVYLALVLFDPRIHWGVHQLFAGNAIKGRELLREARRSGVRGAVVASAMLAIPDWIFRWMGDARPGKSAD